LQRQFTFVPFQETTLPHLSDFFHAWRTSHYFCEGKKRSIYYQNAKILNNELQKRPCFLEVAIRLARPEQEPEEEVCFEAHVLPAMMPEAAQTDKYASTMQPHLSRILRRPCEAGEVQEDCVDLHNRHEPRAAQHHPQEERQ
jgi:hypothetical protein